MAKLNSLTRMITKPLPRVISPRAHAVADCLRIGAYIAGAGWLWNRNRRAATAALVCAVAEGTLVFFTDYDGDSPDRLSFRTHRKLDVGMAATASAAPQLFSFEDDRSARKLFLAQGVLSTAVLELTRETPRKIPATRRVA